MQTSVNSLLHRSDGLRTKSRVTRVEPGDVVVGMLAGAAETKGRPAVGIASGTYLVERPDVLERDLAYVSDRIAAAQETIDLTDYPRQTMARHQAAILEFYGF